jgi:hypothetical protein
MKTIKVLISGGPFPRKQYWSTKIFFVFVPFLLTLFCVQPLEAQRTPFPHQREGLRRQGHGCWQSPDLAFTEEQTRVLEGLQRGYTAEALPLRRELISLRFELFHLIRDSNLQSNILFDRQRRISELRAKLDNLSLSVRFKLDPSLRRSNWIDFLRTAY